MIDFSLYKNLPNFLTVMRILLTPVIIACLYFETGFWNNMAVVFFVIASLTDYFDGYLARKYQLKSTFGQLIDPVADKILINSVLIMLVASKQLDAFVVIVFMVRDTFVQGIRAYAALENLVIEAVIIGKWKTVFQMIGLVAIIVDLPIALPLDGIGYGLLCIGVVLSLISGYQYCFYYYKNAFKKV